MRTIHLQGEILPFYVLGGKKKLPYSIPTSSSLTLHTSVHIYQQKTNAENKTFEESEETQRSALSTLFQLYTACKKSALD